MGSRHRRRARFCSTRLNSAEDIQKIVEPGMRTLGLDPSRLRYLIITHAHGDHFGGARYLRERYGVRIMASTTDWREMERPASGGWQTPASWAALVPEHDLDISDGQTFTLGRATLHVPRHPGTHREPSAPCSRSWMGAPGIPWDSSAAGHTGVARGQAAAHRLSRRTPRPSSGSGISMS